MPILATDKYGAGPLYTFVSTDPNAVLKEGVVYYQTSNNQNAVLMSSSSLLRFFVEGSIFSIGTAIAVAGSGGASIVVTDVGYVGGDFNAISSTGLGIEVVNSGTIEATFGTAIAVRTVSGQGACFITNSGLIRATGRNGSAIILGDGSDQVVNTGTIVGSVSLGNGSNYIDTHLGQVTGRLIGGTGTNTFVIAGTERIAFGTGLDTVISHGDYALGFGGERLELLGNAKRGAGNSLGNNIVGNNNDNVLIGHDGNDTLSGFDGDDLLIGGEGNDLLVLGAGNGIARGGAGVDTFNSSGGGDKSLFGDAGNDLFDLASGTNSVAGGTGDDEVRPGLSADIIDGGSDFDTVDYSFTFDAVTVNLTTGIGTGGSAEGDLYTNVERVLGTFRSDTLIGSARGDTLDGGDGTDLLQGMGGQDILFVGLGDTVDGGTGFDTAVFSGDIRMTVNLTTGVAAFEELGTATLIAIENADGGLGGDLIIGSSAINILRGKGGGDTLDAGRGNDTLDGGTGNDTLTGGLNNDTFLFGEVAHGQDIVTDFEAGDTISFFGNTSVAAFGALTISQSGLDTLIVTPGGEILLQDYAATGLTADRFIFADGARGIPDPAPVAMPNEFAI